MDRFTLLRRAPLLAGLLVVVGVLMTQPALAGRLVGSVVSRVQTTSVDTAPFMVTDQGRPIGWGCAQVPVVVNASLGGAGALDDARAAIELVAGLSGVDLVYAGTTSAMPSTQWYRKENGRPPVLLAWSTPALSDVFATSEELGAAIANPAGTGKDRHIVTGVVALNADALGEYSPGLAAGKTRGVVLVHELLHLVGLGHTTTPGALTSAEILSNTPLTLNADEAGRLRMLRPRCD